VCQKTHNHIIYKLFRIYFCLTFILLVVLIFHSSWFTKINNVYDKFYNAHNVKDYAMCINEDFLPTRKNENY